MPAFTFTPTPHEEAIALIKGKAAVTRDVFDGMLPELRARAFTVTGVEGANVLQRVRDLIAELPQGTVWDKAKSNIVDELSPFLGDGAERRAEILLRTHAFQAFQASNWRVAQEDEDTTHLQYLATEDDNVRDSHLALNGLILPKNDPFWEKHFPPWEWGCRCRTRPLNPDFVAEAKAEDEQRDPENRLVMEGPALERLRNGQLQRDGRSYDVTPPSDSQLSSSQPLQWHPDNLRLPLDELKQRYDPEVWTAFEQNMKAVEILPGVSTWAWLGGKNDVRALADKSAARTGPISLSRADTVELDIAGQSIPIKIADLVNEDGTVTKYYWEYWTAMDLRGDMRNKTELKRAGLGVRKDDRGRWVIPGLVPS